MRMVDCAPIYDGMGGELSYWDKQIFGSRVGVVRLSPAITTRLMRPITAESRDVVERNFGVTVAQQIIIETYLDSLSVITPLSLPEISSIMSPVWCDVWDRFVVIKRSGER